ncbi:MAG: hypothetical protein AB1730_09435 [Myxococcota bacterium]
MSPERTRPPSSQVSGPEVEEILERATRLERARQVEKAGLSDEELAALAKESGLDPTVLRRAARDVTERKKAKTTRFVGAPTRRTFERVVEGELTADQHEHLAAEIVDVVRGITSYTGQLAAVGRTLTWTGMTTGGLVSISVLPRDGRTVIRVEVNAGQLAGGLFGGIIGGVGGGLGTNVAWIIPKLMHLPVVAGVVGAAAVVVSAWGGARALYVSRVNKVYDAMSELADRLEDRTQRLVGPG